MAWPEPQGVLGHLAGEGEVYLLFSLNTSECILGSQKAPYLKDSLSPHITCTYQGQILSYQREDISVV